MVYVTSVFQVMSGLFPERLSARSSGASGISPPKGGGVSSARNEWCDDAQNVAVHRVLGEFHEKGHEVSTR